MEKVVNVITLPEKIRRTLEKVVKEMRVAENVYGIGLFGSWSRGDTAETSDVDLLIFDKSDFNHEYVERMELGGVFIDLDRVPKRWIQGPIPPEIDQKLYEVQVLYDRDWSLANTKLLMAKSYSSPERVDIRTETHVIDSDIFLSRATSAFSREDLPSAYLFSTVALENILKILVEIALEPFSNSRFLNRLEVSATKLGMQGLFKEYLEMTGLGEVNSAGAKDKMKLFKVIWNEIGFNVKRNARALEASHFKVKTKLNYYLNPVFLQGALMRTNSLVDTGKAAEASYYLKGILLDIVENYVWLKSSVDKIKVDYTTLIRSLETLEEKNPKSYNQIVSFLDLDKIRKANASNAIEKSREIMLKIRKDRKVLIKNHLITK
ncbi:MAG: nucleotidyltransferase domain-containing protein [Candidatus Bathyarchaeota archaeon]|nr:nucleotidyltransferase domain-containing protein [Candidatus Bathyarchaeota archaeon]